MRTTYLCVLICACLWVLVLMAGCDSEKASVGARGTMKMELAAEVNGTRYELHNSVFIIESGVDSVVLAEEPVETVTYDLDPGNYEIELQPGWQMYKESASGVLEPVAANLTSDNPAPFAIEANVLTPVGFFFDVGDNVIPFGRGSVELGIYVNEVSETDTDPVTPEFSAISVGYGHKCGIRASDAEVLCWDLYIGQASPPTGVAFDSVSAGLEFDCGVRSSDKEVQCWGDNSIGQATPPTGVAFDSVSAGMDHACGIRSSDKEVQCWGSAPYGTPVPTGVAFSSVSAGSRVTCGIRVSDSEVQCWGDNSWGADVPPTGVAFDSVSTEYYYHTCGIRTSDGLVQCWGDDEYGESTPPAGVVFTSVSAGFNHTCGIRASDSEVQCWGGNTYNTYGQFNTPVGVAFSAVSAGSHTTCGIRQSDGVVDCW
jgi:hypothetical protein